MPHWETGCSPADKPGISLPKVAKNKWKLKVGNPNEKLQQ